MTQEEKELLLKDLCGRLPYGVNIQIYYEDMAGSGYFDETVWGVDNAEPFHVNDWGIEHIKPYLRPMSSMTLDELDDCVTNDGFRDIPCPNYKGSKEECEQQRLEHSIKVFKTDGYRVDWLNAHHFDYRGLIPMGIAIEAPVGMYK